MLTALILVPLAGAAAAALAGHLRGAAAARWTALAVSVAVLGLAVAASTAALAADGGITESVAMRGYSFWNLAADGLAVPLVALTAFLGVVGVLASWSVEKAPGAHYALVLALLSAVMGVFLAADVIVFYVAWEAVLIPMYFLIGIWGHERRRHAATKFFIYTFAGSVLMFVGLLIAVVGSGGLTFAAIQAAGIPEQTRTVVFWLLAAGFLVKVPVFPLHTWLPDAHVEAPTVGSVLLAGVLLKMGPYGLLRLAVPLAPEAFTDARWLLATLGIVGILYGAVMALAQADLKRLVAYSSVAHMGFVVLAVAAATPYALGGAMLGMVSHGLVAGLLFLLVGILYERTHTREIRRFGGLGTSIPKWATVFTFAALASAGLPGLSGFPGEFIAITEAFGPFGWWAGAAAAGAVLAAAYNLFAVRRVTQGAPSADAAVAGIADIDLRETVAVAMLGVGIVTLGVWPGFVLGVAGPALTKLVASLGGVG